MEFNRFAKPMAALATLWLLGVAILWTLPRAAPFATAILLVAALALTLVLIWNGARPRYHSDRFSEAPHATLAGLRLLLDQFPALVVGIGSDGRAHALNRAARAWFMTGDLIQPVPDFVRAFTPSARDDVVLLKKNGIDYAHRLNFVLVPGTPGLHAFGILANIEPQIRAAQAESLRSLLRIIGHEVMNGLAPVTALAETLPDLVIRNEIDAARETAQLIARKAQAIERFTGSYRALAQIPLPRRHSVDCADIAADLRRSIASRWGETVKFDLICGCGVAQIDRDLIMQALWALLTNAVQACAHQASPEVLVSLSCEAGFRAEVRDNGGGIPESIRKQIFNPFFSTKPEGDGVGLAIAQQIARAHGGNIELIEATPQQQGAVFCLFCNKY